MNVAERDNLLALLLTPGLGPTLVGRCVETFGSATDAVAAPATALARVSGISRQGAMRIREGLDALLADGAPQREREAAERAGVQLLAITDPDYPRLLKHIPDPPPLLWMRGELREDDALALAIVGSRRCTHYGREQADRFAYQCAQAGLCLVSGGAYGIDAAAHRAALRADGRTIAVLGSGLAKPYPREHAELFDQIATQGAVLSELPMDTPPAAEHFPRRNRIISGLALGVLVVEAARRSGALITARLCVEEHGREVMAVPGRVDSPASEGCHAMIREGWARLVTNAADVLDGLGEAGQILKAQVQVDSPEGAARASEASSPFDEKLTDRQRAIVDALGEPRTLDELVVATNLSASQVQAELTMLEVRGTVQRQQGRFVRRRGEGAPAGG